MSENLNVAATVAANARISINSQDKAPVASSGYQVLTLKKNNNGFPGASFAAPVISKGQILSLINEQAESCPLLDVLVETVTQGQRDLVRAAILNGLQPDFGSVSEAALLLPGVVEFLQSSGAAGFRFTKDVFELVAPAIRNATLAFYIEKRPQVAQLSAAEQIGAATATIVKYAGLLNMLYVTRNAKESGKAIFSPSDAENLVAIIAMAAAEAEASGADALAAALAGVGKFASDACDRASAADLL